MALSRVTGENPEEIKGTLNGQLESEIDPTKIYKRALVEGNLNKQTQQEIAEAVQRAKRAYRNRDTELCSEIYRATLSIATDASWLSELTLGDLEQFTERFLANHRRQSQKKGDFVEFIVPDVLKPFESSPTATEKPRSTVSGHSTKRRAVPRHRPSVYRRNAFICRLV